MGGGRVRHPEREPESRVRAGRAGLSPNQGREGTGAKRARGLTRAGAMAGGSGPPERPGGLPYSQQRADAGYGQVAAPGSAIAEDGPGRRAGAGGAARERGTWGGGAGGGRGGGGGFPGPESRAE